MSFSHNTKLLHSTAMFSLQEVTNYSSIKYFKVYGIVQVFLLLVLALARVQSKTYLVETEDGSGNWMDSDQGLINRGLGEGSIMGDKGNPPPINGNRLGLGEESMGDKGNPPPINGNRRRIGGTVPRRDKRSPSPFKES